MTPERIARSASWRVSKMNARDFWSLRLIVSVRTTTRTIESAIS
jgi:hypothetical protein